MQLDKEVAMNRWAKLVVMLCLVGAVFTGAEVKAYDPYYVPPVLAPAAEEAALTAAATTVDAGTQN